MFVLDKVVLSFGPINCSPGLCPLCNGVARHASSTRYGLVDFFNEFLTVYTACFVSSLL